MKTVIVCPRSSDPFNLVTYYKTWVTTSWTDGKLSFLLHLLLKAEPSLRPRLRDFIKLLANKNCLYIKKNVYSAHKKIMCYYLVYHKYLWAFYAEYQIKYNAFVPRGRLDKI